MPHLTADKAASICSGRLIGDGAREVHTVVADSREVGPGTAFAAVRGGHEFVADACARGAPFVLVQREDVVPGSATGIVVDDVVVALGALAAAVRAKLDVKVVGITGSTGKTLTKDFVAAALRSSRRVHAARASYNNEIGVPLVVLSCPDDADVLVVELAARHPGEIGDLCRITRPEVGVITGIGTTHLQVFGSREAIARTKAELLAALPADGAAVVPSDDDFLALLSDSTAARLATVGPGGRIGYRARSVDGSGRTHGSIRVGSEDVEVTLPVPGRALMRDAALAVAVAVHLGVPPARAVSGIRETRPSAWRMEIVRLGRLTVVNDAWNANPTSMAAALRTVRELAADGDAWAVLGPMAELGPMAPAAHRRMGRLAAALGYTGVVAVGDEAAQVAEAAGHIAHRVASLDEAAALIASHAGPGAFVLVKGSRVAGLERFPDALERAAQGVDV